MAIKTTKTRWKDVVLVCRKCQKKLNGGFGPDGDKTLKKALKKYLRPGDEWESRLMLTQSEGEETTWDAKLFYHGDVAVSAKLVLAKVKNPPVKQSEARPTFETQSQGGPQSSALT